MYLYTRTNKGDNQSNHAKTILQPKAPSGVSYTGTWVDRMLVTWLYSYIVEFLSFKQS